MSNISKSQMNAWVKMVNENTFSYKPDTYKQDDLDKNGDAFEELQNEIDDYYKEVERTGNIKGTLKEDDEEVPVDGNPEDAEAGKTDEAMSIDDILSQHKSKDDELAAIQAEIAQKVKKVDITDMYDGYVACDVVFNDGRKESMEFDISEDELKDMLAKIEPIAHAKKADFTIEDAAIAVVRKRLDPTDKLDWFYKPTNSSLDQWFLDRDIENEKSITTYEKQDASWANQLGLFADDSGDMGDDSAFNAWDDNSKDAFVR